MFERSAAVVVMPLDVWCRNRNSPLLACRARTASQNDIKPLSLTVHRIHEKLDGVVSALAYKDVRFKRNQHGACLHGVLCLAHPPSSHRVPWYATVLASGREHV